ncbi:MAG: methyl-accepting chemotaxis protein [Gammaproteobacteria bacterium]|nr:methyl-accepting chemotaxis protein [Gammaproteobacteria bacterium]
MVHETQKERGATAGYLGSKGKKFAEILPQQHTTTDIKIADLRAYLTEIDVNSYGAEFAKLLNDSLARLDQLPEIRKNVLNLKMATPKAIGFYTQTNKMFLEMVGSMTSLTQDGEIARNVGAYYNFLLGKERAGIERAVLSNTFASDTFGPGMFAKFRTLVSEQNTYANVFLSLATEEERNFYEQKMDNAAVKEVEKMRATAATYEERNFLISEVRRHFGYGGLIHSFKNYVLRGQSKHLKSFEADYQEIIEHLDEYAALAGITEEARSLINVVRDTVNAYKNGIEKSVRLRNNGANITELDQAVKINDGPALNAIDKLAQGNFGVDSVYWFKTQTAKINLLKEVDDYMSKTLLAQVEEHAAEARNEQFFYLVLSILAIGVALLISYAVARSITGNIVRTRNLLADIAEGEGDLTQRLEINGTDEIAQLSENFNKFAGRIEDMVIEVKEVAQSIRVSAGEIAMGNTDLSHRTEEQASSLEETAASMEQMTASVKQNADNARQANQLVSSTRDLASTGGETVQRAVEAMEEINTSSRKVADIISVIDGIAFQTNLLALNAAVEAARAGEQGRGFAVVAGEVRNLAGRSAEAAKEIKALIEDSVQKAEHGSALVDASGKTLDEIVTGVKKVADIVSEIASASQEQSTGIGEVGSAITQMDEVTQQNAALVEEAAAASESMEEQSNQLIEEMSAFKVSG